jgi:hypothetical protein
MQELAENLKCRCQETAGANAEIPHQPHQPFDGSAANMQSKPSKRSYMSLRNIASAPRKFPQGVTRGPTQSPDFAGGGELPPPSLFAEPPSALAPAWYDEER